jgi:hypothetical protein
LADGVLKLCAGFEGVPLYRLARHRILGEQARLDGRQADAIGEFRAAAALEPKIAHRQYLIEALPANDPERLELCLNAVRIPWQRLQPPPLHCLGSLNVATSVVLANGVNEPFAERFGRGKADVARMV